MVCVAGMWMSAAAAWSMPVEIKDADVTLVLPEGFEQEGGAQTNASAEVVYLFTRRQAEEEPPDALLTIRRIGSNDPPDIVLWASNSTLSAENLRRYSERLNETDIEVLAARATNEPNAMAESTARLTLGTNTIQIDLKSREMRDNEMKEVMRRVLAGAAPTGPPPQDEGFKGWGAVILCAVLALAILVVVMGKSRI